MKQRFQFRDGHDAFGLKVHESTSKFVALRRVNADNGAIRRRQRPPRILDVGVFPRLGRGLFEIEQTQNAFGLRLIEIGRAHEKIMAAPLTARKRSLEWILRIRASVSPTRRSAGRCFGITALSERLASHSLGKV